MFYISGIFFNPKKSISTNLQSIYGLGKNRTKFLCRYLGLAENLKSVYITEQQELKLKTAIQVWKHEDELRQYNLDKIQELKIMGSYRGLRHRQFLPCRGQNTYSNARTRKKFRKSI
jgi:small subunit ribosomal protein S13